MMNRTALLALIFPVVIVGCAATSQNTESSGSVTASSQANNPIVANIPEPPTGGSNGNGTTGGEGQTGQHEPPVNPNRMFQLKDLEVAEVKIGEHPFKLWVMDTYAKRQEGMMYLQNSDFKDDEGMIFVFGDSAPRNFWMKNTFVPLDIAYINPSKTILNVLTMKAHDIDTPYNSRGSAMYVIEVRAGLFAKLEIKAGTKVTLPEGLKSKD
ncbi:MAG: DUF192 domain-containing protein [Fimbriimonadaceae bacterium]|nr:DUF192 domain-containing protein [Fimbriimonadaceae bacterium]